MPRVAAVCESGCWRHWRPKIHKTAAALAAIQQGRKAAYDQARVEAMYLTQLSLAGANSFEPAQHFGAPDLHGGFVYSPDEIKLALLRLARLDEARARFTRAARAHW